MRLVGALITGALRANQACAQTSRYDGDYGNPNGAMGTGASCSTTRFGFRLAVKNGQASMRTVTAGTLEGPVGPDGTINILQGRTTLQGRINGPKFTGTLSMGPQCQFPLDYKRF